MAAKRADGFDGDERRKVLDGAKQVKKDLRQKKNSFGGSGVKEGKWKAQSNQLREAMANMRAISKAEKGGKPLPPAMPAWAGHVADRVPALRPPLQPEGRRAPHPEVPVDQGQAEDSYAEARAAASAGDRWLRCSSSLPSTRAPLSRPISKLDSEHTHVDRATSRSITAAPAYDSSSAGDPWRLRASAP